MSPHSAANAPPSARSSLRHLRQVAQRPEWMYSGARQSKLDGLWVRAVLLDTIVVLLSGLVAFTAKFGFVPSSGTIAGVALAQYGGAAIIYLAVIVLACQAQGLYEHGLRKPLDEALGIARALLLATLLLAAFLYLSGSKDVSRLVVGGSAILALVLMTSWRVLRRQWLRRHGSQVRNTLIIGAGRVGQALAAYLNSHPEAGYAVRGFLDGNQVESPHVLGRLEDFATVVRQHFVDEVLITIPSAREVVKTVAAQARRQRINVQVLPDFYDGLGWNKKLEYIGDFPAISLHREPIPTFWLMCKRMLDIAGALVGLVITAPAMLAIAIAIKLDSPGPVFYRSTRSGKKGRGFVCFKFRSMVHDADTRKKGLRHLNEREGPTFKITNDPRLTRLGRLLRKYSLDEIPQFWNVLKGEMSLVGPRPHPLDDCEYYELDHLRRLDVVPGMTGLWQVTARRDASFERNMELDLEYIETWSPWLDFKILLQTIPAVFRGEGE